jgi:hypothetical protein
MALPVSALNGTRGADMRVAIWRFMNEAEIVGLRDAREVVQCCSAASIMVGAFPVSPFGAALLHWKGRVRSLSMGYLSIVSDK